MEGKKGDRPAFGKFLRFGNSLLIQLISPSGSAMPSKLHLTTPPALDSTTLPIRASKPERGKSQAML